MRNIPMALAFCAASAFALPAGAMELTSPDFAPNGAIALEQIYPECGGKNISPALSWSGVPPTAKSLALSVFDPDGGPHGWWHWTLIDIPADTRGIAKAMPPAGARSLKNDFGHAAYDGPCPPKGSGVHHYQFTLYALPKAFAAVQGASPSVVGAALAKEAIAQTTLIGTVER